MYAALINAVGIIIASILGIFFKNKINLKYTNAIIVGLAVVVGVLGLKYTFDSDDTIGIIICLILGIFIGEALRLEDRLETLGDKIKKKVSGITTAGAENFTEGFVVASLLFCVGPMAILGSLQAGINGDTSIILSKTMIDSIVALSFSVAMGIGVIFSGISVLIYQGLITLLAIWISPYLGTEVINELSAVGGILMICICLNMLELPKNKIRVGNMLPAIFLPVIYQPLVAWLTTLF